MEGDEVKTIVCRYPEPVVPPPLGPPLPISVANTPTGDPVPNRLAEPQILMIICALLFLAMMLFGVACSYFCLKQRNIKLIRRRRALSSGLGSEITGITEQTIFPPFAGLKIPRAHASSSGSDQQPIVESSDTLPSDYPSESRSGSEMEEGDTRSLRRASTVSSVALREEMPVQQRAYEPDLSSVYSDAHNQFDVDTFTLPTTIPRIDPSFDVAFRVKERHRSPAPSSVTSEESRATTVNVLTAQERALTTILEREEWRQSEMRSATANALDCPPLNEPADSKASPPPGYAQVKRKPRSVLSQRSIPENETWSVTEHVDIPDGRIRDVSPARSLESQARSVGEMVLKSSRPYVPQPEATFRVTTEIPERHETVRTLVINEDIQLHTNTFRQLREDEETETMIVPTPERPVPPPKLSTQEVDDLYLQTITETRIIDEEERIRRQKTEFLQRPRPAALPPNWDVAIRTHPPAQHPPRSPSATTVSTIPNWDVTIRQYPPAYEPRTPSESTNWDGMSHVEPQPPPDFDVTIRQYPPVYEPRTPSESTNWDGMSQVEPQPPPDWGVTIRQYPPVYEPRTPSESTNWDGMSTVDQQPPPDWDVTIRQYPPVYEPRTPSESTNWDGMSTVDPNPPTGPPPDWDVKIRQYPPIHSPRVPSESTDWDPSEYARSVTSEHPPPNWDVLIRVLNPPPESIIDEDDDATSILTVEDRKKWQQIITTESTLRTMLTEAVVREDFERIRRDTRFQRVFEPKKWDVIIRVLAPPPTSHIPDDSSDTRSETTVNSEPIRPYTRRDPRSSRSSSLAPVHETEYHRTTVSHTANHEFRYHRGEPDVWSEASANTQRSSIYPRSTADRSLHSEMVHHLERRPRDWDGYSDGEESGQMSRPSLARSTSEFTEHWQRLPYDRVSNASENFSTASSRKNSRAGRPVLERSSTEVMEDVPQMESGGDRLSTGSSSNSSREFSRRVPYERISSSESESARE